MVYVVSYLTDQLGSSKIGYSRRWGTGRKIDFLNHFTSEVLGTAILVHHRVPVINWEIKNSQTREFCEFFRFPNLITGTRCRHIICRTYCATCKKIQKSSFRPGTPIDGDRKFREMQN